MFKRLQPLFPYFKKHRWGYALGSVCVVLQNGIAVFIPLLIGRAIDHLRHGINRQQLLIDASLILGVTCAKGVFLYLNRKIVISISREIEFEMRNDIFRHLEKLSYSFYQRTRTGDIMARTTNDLNAVRNLLGPAIMYSANTLVFTLAALYFMVHISPWLTLYAF